MASPRENRARRTLGVAMVLALLLHGALLLVDWEDDRKPRRTQVRRSVALVELPPRESESKRVSADSSPRVSRAVRAERGVPRATSPASSAVPPVAAKPTEVVPPLNLPNAGPRRRDLFPSELLGVREPGTHGEDPEHRAADRLDRWRGEWAEKERARIKVRTAELIDLERRIQSWFEPPTEAMREAGLRKMPWHESLPKLKLPYLDPETWRGFAQGLEGNRPPNAAPLQLPPPVVLCVVGCGESKKAALEAIVEVFHDERGVPESWEIAKSSGTPVFDNAALRAIDDTLRLHPGKMFDDPTQTPEWTRWQFAGTGYWWRWGQLALSPTFKPHGRTQEDMTGFGGKTTVAREVKLLETRFWPEEHAQPDAESSKPDHD